MSTADPDPGPAPGPADSVPNGLPPAFPGTPGLGTRLGRYEILSVLGHGAMATVFRARDTQLGRTVAVKVMSMAVAARGGAAERFRREAHAVAALRYRGIVEIFDFVDAAGGEPSYIVAELIEGPTLRRLLDDRQVRLLPEVAALIALPLAEALAVAHEHGIVHRDVKPDNVMVDRANGAARVVVTDFGVAHITGMETMTASGALIGSPAYMSPEQARCHDVGPAADIWAVGALLYEMATGCLPFPGKDPITVISAIARGTFRRPSQLVATVGPGFEQIVVKCLRPRPADRYAKTADLAADLRRLVQGAGLEPEEPSLRRFLDAPPGFEAGLRPRVADAAIAQARRHARRGELARALAEIGRAIAYVPSHKGARALLRRLSAGRTALRVVGGVLALLVVAGGLWFGRGLLARRHVAPVPAPTVTEQASAPPRASPPAPALLPPAAAGTVQNELVPPRDVQAAPLAAAARPAPKKAPRPRMASREPAPNEAVAEAAPAPEAPQPAAAPAPVAAVAPAPVAPSDPRPGVIRLFAKRAICYPSLDGHPPELMPIYKGVAPGKHKVYCARDQHGAKELVGEIDLPAGAYVERTVVQKDGKLVFPHRHDAP